MTREDKQLLLVDLCARLPYGVKVTFAGHSGRDADGVDWLNKKMFDYRGLIPRGRAIEVTDNNNPYKN